MLAQIGQVLHDTLLAAGATIHAIEIRQDDWAAMYILKTGECADKHAITFSQVVLPGQVVFVPAHYRLWVMPLEAFAGTYRARPPVWIAPT